MSLPSQVAVPVEMQVGRLGSSLPHEARSQPFKLFPTGTNSVSSTFTIVGSSVPQNDQSFPATPIIFDLPCGNSPDMFLDNRFSTINYRMTVSVATAGTSCVVASGFLRSSAYSFFDRMYITSQNGQILEDIGEYGVVADTLINLQMSPALRQSLSPMMGFNSTFDNNQGVSLGIFTSNTFVAGQNESHSFSVPLISSLLGATANNMPNLGRTSKLQLVLQTASILPLTVLTGAVTTGGTYTVTLSDFSLSLETISIGLPALQMIDSTMAVDAMGNKNAYYSGITYRTTTNTIPAGSSGTFSSICGLRGSSVKSLFARFLDTGTNSLANSVNQKYDSKNPNLNSINFNLGGVRFPPTPVNPLLNPSLAFRELQMAIGSFNSSSFQCSNSGRYSILAAGGTATTLTTAINTQDYIWTLGSSVSQLCQFVFGSNVEIIARRGIFSGQNCNNINIILEGNIGTANTNLITSYIVAMLDVIFIHNVMTGDISVRI